MTIRNQIADIDAEIDKVDEETRPLRMKIYSADDQIRELEKRKTDLIAQHADDGGGYFQMMLKNRRHAPGRGTRSSKVRSRISQTTG